MNDDLFYDSEKNIRHSEEFEDEKKIESSSILDQVRVNLTFDKLVITSISLVVLFSVTFALGVEKGKQNVVYASKRAVIESQAGALIQQEWSQKPILQDKIQQMELTRSAQGENVSEAVDNSSVNNDIATRETEITRENSLVRQDGSVNVKKYIIQLVTYVASTRAEKTAKKLSGKGYEAFVKQSGKYFTLNVGPFVGKKDAKAVLSELRKELGLNKDGFIKTFRK